MAANINSIAWVGAQPWHKLGRKVDALMNSSEALEYAGLDWTVRKENIYTRNNIAPISRQYAMVRSDNNEALGIVGEYYKPLQNKEAFSFFDAVVQDKLAMFEVAGALGGGERVWMLAKLPGQIKVTNQDMIDKYVLLSNTHDGSSPVIMQITPVRVVCQNTLNLAMKGDTNRFLARHTISLGGKVKDAREKLQIVNQWYAEFEQASQNLAKQYVTAKQLDQFLNELWPVPTEEEKAKTSKSIGIQDDIKMLFEHGRGQELASVKGTKWALWNAVTEYTDHLRSTKMTNGFKTEDEARLNSQWFGSGRELKTKAFEVINRI